MVTKPILKHENRHDNVCRNQPPCWPKFSIFSKSCRVCIWRIGVLALSEGNLKHRDSSYRLIHCWVFFYKSDGNRLSSSGEMKLKKVLLYNTNGEVRTYSKSPLLNLTKTKVGQDVLTSISFVLTLHNLNHLADLNRFCTKDYRLVSCSAPWSLNMKMLLQRGSK